MFWTIIAVCCVLGGWAGWRDRRRPVEAVVGGVIGAGFGLVTAVAVIVLGF